MIILPSLFPHSGRTENYFCLRSKWRYSVSRSWGF